MGLLSRFGRGLTQAAPIMGQMAQVSMLQAADEKKYNRLIEREDKKYGRELEAAELAYKRGSAAAGRKERITFLDTGINLISDQINTEIEGLTQLREDKAAALTPINRQIVDAMIKQGEDRLAKAIETRNRISSMYQSYVDPEGKLGVFSEPEEKSILTDAAIIQAANLARNEIVGFEGREGPGIGGDTLTTFEVASTIDRAPELIEEQLKDIDDSLVGKAEPLNEKQKQLFRDTVNTYVQARQSRGGLPSPDTSWSGEEAAQIKTLPEEAEVVKFVEPREGLRAATQEDLEALLREDIVLYGNPDNILSRLIRGGWKGMKWIWNKLGEKRARDWKERLLEMGIDPDATPISSGESAMINGDKPSVEDSIAMMFTQRV